MKYKTAFRLAIRAIGVLVLANSLPWCIAGLASLAAQLADVNLRGPVDYISWSIGIGPILGHGVGIVIGLYLLSGGRWIVDRVIPSNRPYCPECGYDLTHLPSDYRCPECGVPYRHAVSASPVDPPLPNA